MQHTEHDPSPIPDNPADRPYMSVARKAGYALGLVVAFFIGVGAGSDGDPETVVETVEVPPEDLAEREADLDEREADLVERENAVDALAGQLAEREQEVETRETAADEQEEQVAANTFGPGNVLVGEDVEPGTYRAEVTSGMCYYERLSGLGGTPNDLIVNDIVTEGSALVTIDPGDVAFNSNGCGEWTKVG